MTMKPADFNKVDDLIIGRIFWTETHPSPWVAFRTQGDFLAWRIEIRRRREGVKVEYAYVNATHTAESLLVAAGLPGPEEMEELMSFDPYEDEDRYGEARSTKATLFQSKADRLRAQADKLEEKAAFYDSLPSEPNVEDPDEPNVIWFRKPFIEGGKAYTYAAVKAGDELWYTTGPKSPKGYTWASLIEWIADGNDGSIEVWSAEAWELLG